ncbi:MAG: TetR/AcrR family transcriptional regulator [Pseudomonadales bacterium]
MAKIHPEPMPLDNENYKFRRPIQARGQEKFDRILDAADEIVAVNGADDLSLYDIAEKAGVAVGSVYHFFPSTHAVLVALVERYDSRFQQLVQTAPHGTMNSWQDVIWFQTEQSRNYINSTPGAIIMILGSGQTWATRLADEKGDQRIAEDMAKAIERFFVLPTNPPAEDLLFNSIRMLEALWATSYIRHGEVTGGYAKETHKAIVAYLSQYWPPFLEPTRQPATE